MDVILHIGMPKTGSTAIQGGLARNRSFLTQNGILYPELSAMGHAHHLLMPLWTSALWPAIARQLAPDPKAAAAAEWDSVLRQIDDARPRRLLISTEALYVPFVGEELEPFVSRLRAVGSSFTIVDYVREPARFYSSLLMEQAKRSSRLRNARPIMYRQAVEMLETALGASVVMRKFDRASLHRGDVRFDFEHHVLGLELPEVAKSATNVSLSPETAFAFQRYMAKRTGTVDWPLDPADRKLIRALVRSEQRIGRARTGLRAEFADYVTYASKDLLWVRDRFGIVFDEVDYDRLRDYRPGPVPQVPSLRDAFDLDDAFLEQMTRAVRTKTRGLRRLLSGVAG